MPVTFPTTPLTVKVELALGADLTADPTTWTWTDITAYVRYNPSIRIQRGSQDEKATSPGQVNLTLDNTSGRFTPRHPSSPYYPYVRRNTPLKVSVDPGTGYVSRGIFYVDEWPLEWDVSGHERHVSITASGLLRRLDQGTTPAKSPLVRSISGNSTMVSYWPCEDESGSTQFAEYSGGTPGMASNGVQFAADATLASGGGALPTFPSSCFARWYVRPFTATGEWAVAWVMKIPTDQASNTVIMNIASPTGTIGGWRINIIAGSPDTMLPQAYDHNGNELLGGGAVNFQGNLGANLYDRWLLWQVNATQNGSDVDWEVLFEAEDGDGAGKVGTATNQTCGTVTEIHHNSGTTIGDHQVGHMAVFSDADIWASTIFEAFRSHVGEEASFRFSRICNEEGIPFDIVPLSGFGEPMGPQPNVSAMDVIRDVEATDGILREDLTGILSLTVREDLYNQAAALALDHDQHHLQPGFTPVEDDQGLRNDVTATRPTGSSARVINLTSVANEGRYDETITVNPSTDAALPYHAQWHVALGTVDDFRYPAVRLNFARTPTLITSWLATDIGEPITIANPPDELPPNTIELQLLGYTEEITRKNWGVELNCRSGLPWQVFTVEGSNNTGRLDATGCEVLAARTSASTSVLVSMTNDTLLERGSPTWSTSTVPYDLNIAGERVTATAVTNGAATFIGAGTAAHADNASVSPSLHASTATDDLIVVFAAIRNTAAKVVTPSGYTQLWPAANADSHVKILGKIAASGEAAPTITFTGGSAGDTTSGHCATFRRAQCAVHNYGSSTNASAQNIAFPALATARDNCIILYAGWKQDDWTSVATVGGATEIGEPSTITGNDQGLVWNYVIQTTATYIVSGSFTVTGGASAVSKGIVIAIPTDVQTLTLTRSVNGISKALTAGTEVKLWRPNVVAL